MRRAQPRIDSDRDLKTSVKMTIVQNQRLKDLSSIAEQCANIDEHVKAVTALTSPVWNLVRDFRFDAQQIFPSRACRDPIVNLISIRTLGVPL